MEEQAQSLVTGHVKRYTDDSNTAAEVFRWVYLNQKIWKICQKIPVLRAKITFLQLCPNPVFMTSLMHCCGIVSSLVSTVCIFGTLFSQKILIQYHSWLTIVADWSITFLRGYCLWWWMNDNPNFPSQLWAQTFGWVKSFWCEWKYIGKQTSSWFWSRPQKLHVWGTEKRRWWKSVSSSQSPAGGCQSSLAEASTRNTEKPLHF